MKNISQAMNLLGFKKGSSHGVKRAVYLFRFAKNLENVIKHGKRPIFYNRDIGDITDHWKKRWATKRLVPDYPKDKLFFSRSNFLSSVKKDIIKCKHLMANNR